MKLNSDHRNSISWQMPAAGATGGIQFHGKCPPQARPAESLFTAILTVGGGDRWPPPHFVLIPASYNFPARGANTARLRAITIKEHSARSPQLRHGCPLSRTCRTSATKSPLGLFKENPTRIFFQGEPPTRVRPLCAFGANSPTPAFCGRKSGLCPDTPQAL